MDDNDCKIKFVTRILTESKKVGLKMLSFQQMQSDLKIFFKLLEQSGKRTLANLSC